MVTRSQDPQAVSAPAAAPATSARRRRVMLFTDSFIHGGTERQFVEVARNLDREKFDLRIGCFKARGPFLPDVQQLNVPIHEIPIRSLYGFHTAAEFVRLVRFLRAQKIELVHTFDFYSNSFVIPAARLAGVPVVMGSVRELVSMRSRLHRMSLGVVTRLAHAVVVNSEAARRALDPGLRSRRFRLVHNGVPPDRYRPRVSATELRRHQGLGPDPLVGVVSALRPEKGHRLFLDAAAQVAASEPHARFVLVGDGSERSALEAQAKALGLDSRIVFVGDTDDVASWLGALDIVVMPSRAESLSNAVLEAMGAGRPVIATNVGGNPEVVEDGKTGYLVPPADPKTLAERVLALLRDPALRQTMGQAARDRVEQEFTSEKMMERMEAVYEQELSRAKPRVKILQMGNFPPPMCGWAMITYHTHKALLDRGADALVLDIGPDKRVRREGCIPLFNIFDYVWKILKYRARGYTFFIHVNGDTWKGYTLAALAMVLGRVTGKPGFLGFRAGPQQMYFPRKSGFWRWAFKLLFAASGTILCDSEPVKKAIGDYVPESKVVAISPYTSQYLEEELPAPLPEEVEKFLASHSPRIFSYTLFRPEFTMEQVFAAYAGVRKRFPNAGMLIAGPREIPPEFEQQMQKLGIRDSILVAGNLQHAAFLTAVQRSDIFLRSHLRDGVCASVLESLRLGVPVVAAEDGIRPPSVIKFAPADAHSMEATLIATLNDLPAARAQVRCPDVDDALSQQIDLLMGEAQGVRA